MGKKKKKNSKASSPIEMLPHAKVKSKCCKKYKKAAHKRCKKCPCFDLIKKVA